MSKIIPGIAIALPVLLTFASIGKGTIYDLFPSDDIFNDTAHETLHFKVNGQGMDMLIKTQDDDGMLLSKAHNNQSLPFYRDKNGGLSVHVSGGLDKESLLSAGALMSKIEPLMGFANGHFTKYVTLKLNKEFDANEFLKNDIHDSEALPAYPSAEKINIMQTKQFSIGHYKAQATANAVLVYYDSRLKSQGYKKLREKRGIALYQSKKRLLIINVEEESNYVSIITYNVKTK